MTKLEVINEKRKRNEREELFKHYIATLVTQLGAEKTLDDCLKELEKSRKTGKDVEKDIQEAYSVANNTLEALEKARKEAKHG